MELSTLPLLSFFITFILAPIHIVVFKKFGIVGKDRHKPERPEVAEMGGLTIFIGLIVSYIYILASGGPEDSLYVMSALSIIFLIGVIDDVYAIRQRTKLLLLTSAAAPLILHEGGPLDLTLFEIGYGPLYAVLVVLGMTASSNLTNILEGFNGESIGLGVISVGFLLLDAHILGNETMIWILLPLFASLLAFLFYNRYPAKVFPGDTGTLMIGGGIGISVIVAGNVILGIIVLMPQIIEFILKSKIRFKGVEHGPTMVDEEGYLTPPPYLSLANFLTARFRLKEYTLIIFIWSIGALFGLISLFVTIFFL